MGEGRVGGIGPVPPLHLPRFPDLEARGQGVEVRKPRIDTSGLPCFSPLPPPHSGAGVPTGEGRPMRRWDSSFHMAPRALCPCDLPVSMCQQRASAWGSGTPHHSTMRSQSHSSLPKGPIGSKLPAPGSRLQTPQHAPRRAKLLLPRTYLGF